MSNENESKRDSRPATIASEDKFVKAATHGTEAAKPEAPPHAAVPREEIIPRPSSRSKKDDR